MSSQETADSPQVKFIRSFVRAMEERDIENIAKHLNKDFHRVNLPRSIGVEDQTKEEWLKRLEDVVPKVLTDCKATLHSIIEAPGGKVVAHLTLKVNTSIGVEVTRESILILDIVSNEDGDLKIKRLQEFIDSKAYLDFHQSVAEARANKQHSASFAA